MSTQQVVIYTCDVCPAEARPETKTARKPLPKGWADMSLVTNEGAKHGHLCADCLDAINKVMESRSTEPTK